MGALESLTREALAKGNVHVARRTFSNRLRGITFYPAYQANERVVVRTFGNCFMCERYVDGKVNECTFAASLREVVGFLKTHIK